MIGVWSVTPSNTTKNLAKEPRILEKKQPPCPFDKGTKHGNDSNGKRHARLCKLLSTHQKMISAAPGIALIFFKILLAAAVNGLVLSGYPALPEAGQGSSPLRRP